LSIPEFLEDAPNRNGRPEPIYDYPDAHPARPSGPGDLMSVGDFIYNAESARLPFDVVTLKILRDIRDNVAQGPPLS
jgi:hypothetical protein